MPGAKPRPGASSLGVGELWGQGGLGHSQAQGPGGGDQGTLGTLQELSPCSDLVRIDDVRVRAEVSRGLDQLVSLQGGHAVHHGVGVGNPLLWRGVLRERQ